jgi:hypothetical protein
MEWRWLRDSTEVVVWAWGRGGLVAFLVLVLDCDLDLVREGFVEGGGIIAR